MSTGLLLVLAAAALLHTAVSYRLGGHRHSLIRSKNDFAQFLSSSSASNAAPEQEEVYYNTIAVSGFVSKEADVAEAFIFDKLHDKAKFQVITSITDNLLFARKRLVTPRAVYSGLSDIMAYEVVASGAFADLSKVVASHEAWLCGNIKPEELAAYVDVAVSGKGALKRAVFGINYSGAPSDRTVETFAALGDKLAAAGVTYTFVKYADLTKLGESRLPYRIVSGTQPLPQAASGKEALGTEDLMRILAELVDIPKTFSNTYGVGPGTALDTEILCYMKAQGWPERVQIGLLMGDMQEKIEKSYELERAGKLKREPAAALPPV